MSPPGTRRRLPATGSPRISLSPSNYEEKSTPGVGEVNVPTCSACAAGLGWAVQWSGPDGLRTVTVRGRSEALVLAARLSGQGVAGIDIHVPGAAT